MKKGENGSEWRWGAPKGASIPSQPVFWAFLPQVSLPTQTLSFPFTLTCNNSRCFTLSLTSIAPSIKHHKRHHQGLKNTTFTLSPPSLPNAPKRAFFTPKAHIQVSRMTTLSSSSPSLGSSSGGGGDLDLKVGK